MKTLLIATLAAGLACGTAAAQSNTYDKSKETTGQSSQHLKSKHGRASADGYYRPGIPTSDPGRYKNLPGKDADYSKAYIQDR
jgi:hypothetical protein